MQCIEIDYILHVLPYYFNLFNFNMYTQFHFLNFTFILNVSFRNTHAMFHCSMKTINIGIRTLTKRIKLTC